MRILIVGAGIAGLTLASLLHRQGKTPIVIERLPGNANLGYVLGLWPQGSRVLHALNIHDSFLDESEPMLRYTLRDARDQLISAYNIPSSISRFGNLGALPRPSLIHMLEKALEDVEILYGVSLDSLSQDKEKVMVRLTDGTEETFDLVIGADGIHSRTRELLFGHIPEYDTGWGCYAWWGNSHLVGKGETVERWGVGNFLGLYPCRDQLGIILGAPVDVLQPKHSKGRIDRIRTLLSAYNLPIDSLLAGFPNDGEPVFLWRMADIRTKQWAKGRVVLVGDAAAAFLPTAGIGASMALESAAVLADELSRTDSVHLEQALAFYVKRRQKRVEAAQEQSRWLARLVFTRSRPLAFIRDYLMRFMSLEQMVDPLIKDLQRPI